MSLENNNTRIPMKDEFHIESDGKSVSINSITTLSMGDTTYAMSSDESVDMLNKKYGNSGDNSSKKISLKHFDTCHNELNDGEGGVETGVMQSPNKKVIFTQPDIAKGRSWYIPEVSSSETFDTPKSIYLYNDNGKKSLRINGANGLMAVDLPLSSGESPFDLKIRDSTGETFSLETTKKDSRASYKEALHIGTTDGEEYVVCSACTITCNMGCSNNTINELTNACDVYSVCTSKCLGFCSNTCAHGTTQRSKVNIGGLAPWTLGGACVDFEVYIPMLKPCGCGNAKNCWVWWAVGVEVFCLLHWKIGICAWLKLSGGSIFHVYMPYCGLGCGRLCDVTCTNGIGYYDASGDRLTKWVEPSYGSEYGQEGMPKMGKIPQADKDAEDKIPQLNPTSEINKASEEAVVPDGNCSENYKVYYGIRSTTNNVRYQENNKKLIAEGIANSISSRVAGMCMNSCEGSCYATGCGLDCNTSCMSDNSCSYFSDAAAVASTSTSQEKIDKMNSRYNGSNCLWCKTSAMLFPI